MLMASFPVSPRYAKMLAVAVDQSPILLAYSIAIVAGLSSGDLFVRDDDMLKKHYEVDDISNDEKDRRRLERKNWYKVMQV